MFTKLRYHTDTRYPVQVYGGPHDGATVLCNNFTPGKVTNLYGVSYVMTWRGDTPELRIA